MEFTSFLYVISRSDKSALLYDSILSLWFRFPLPVTRKNDKKGDAEISQKMFVE